MSNQRVAAPGVAQPIIVPDRESANERFKRSYGSLLWGSTVLAVILHFLFMQFMPSFGVADVSYAAAELEALNLPPEIEIPPPPQAIARPAVPVVAAAAEIEEDITIAPTTFEANPVEALPPPPTEEGPRDISAEPTFTPYTVAPELKNRDEVRDALLREYPPMLRDAGIGGTVIVWFFIDENGKVLKAQINKSSGYPMLDAAAIRIANIYRFTPALNRDRRVKVWVSIPIQFTTR